MSRTAGLVLGLLAVFAFGTWAAWSFVIDDAFITFRYSTNLAEGHGPVWNAGADPVEGFTNFAWMLWHAVFASFDLDLVLVAKVTSVLVGLATLALLMRAVDGAAAVVAGAAYVLFLPTYFHLTGGLETAVFAAVVLRMAVLGMRVLDDRHVHDAEPPLLLLLAGLIRPEGLLAALPGFVVWFHSRRYSSLARTSIATAAVIGIGYFGWRWIYYGHPLPNTFYVKFGDLAAGTAWAERTLVLFAPLLLLTVSLLAWPGLRRVGALFCVTVVATGLPYALSGPTMDYLHRFAFHAFPVLCLGAGVAVAAFGQRVVRAVVGVVAVGWVAVAGAMSPDLPVIANYGTDLHRVHVAIGKGLADAGVAEPDRTLAVSDAGAIPYYSGWRTIDYIGLNDERIAHGADPDDVVREARPTVIVATSYTDRIPEDAYGLDVPVAVAGYHQVGPFQMRDGYWQYVYVLPRWAEQVDAAVTNAVEGAQATHDPGRYQLTIDRWLSRLRGD